MGSPGRHTRLPLPEFSTARGKRKWKSPIPRCCVRKIDPSLLHLPRLILVRPGPSFRPALAPASAVSPLLGILWFGPCGAFFRPGRLIQKPARTAAVKDGRHADLTPRSTASRPLLAGREHDGTLARHGNARPQSSPLPINCSARKPIKIRDPAHVIPCRLFDNDGFLGYARSARAGAGVAGHR
jgi:hypothetical protein